MPCNTKRFVIEVLHVIVEIEQTNRLMIQNIHQFILPAVSFTYLTEISK